MADKKTTVTKLSVFGADKSVRSEISLIICNGRVYIETSDNESGANNRTAKIALSPERMKLLGQALTDIAGGATFDQCTKWGRWNGVTRTVT